LCNRKKVFHYKEYTADLILEEEVTGVEDPVDSAEVADAEEGN
jgi:hypothetical protein